MNFTGTCNAVLLPSVVQFSMDLKESNSTNSKHKEHGTRYIFAQSDIGYNNVVTPLLFMKSAWETKAILTRLQETSSHVADA